MKRGRSGHTPVWARLILFVIAVCFGLEPVMGAEDVRVAVVESRSIRAYDLALEGFTNVMKDNGFNPILTIYVINMDVESPGQLKEMLEGTDSEMILALGTSAARLVKDCDCGIPSVFSMVSEPAQSGLLNSGGEGSTPMTGVCLDVPVREQFASLLDVVPRAKRIGVIYNPEETQFIVDEARKAANRMGLGLVTYPIASEAELPEGLTELRSRIDALWLVS
ncbi:MAG: ABC transporter substrate binding protein, partial [bacterium]